MKYILLSFILVFPLFGCSEKKSETTKTNFLNGATTQFSKLDPNESGIAFTNKIKQTPKFNYTIYDNINIGAGLAVIDYNNDGWQDLYFIANQGSNILYKNNGDLTFTDVTSTSKTADAVGFSTGVSIIDVNEDGWQDIYISKAGSLENDEERKNVLFVNKKDGTFAEEAAKWGLDYPGYSTQAYPLDYDLDGDLDLYLVNHREDFKNVTTISSKIQNDISYLTSDQLFRNDGTFYTNITTETGVQNKTWGLSAVVSDFNDDNWPDIFVCNDFFQPDLYYINNQKGAFVNVINSNIRHISYSSMGSDYADINNDLLPDLITVDMMSDDYARSKENMASMSIDNFRFLVDVGYHHQYSANMLHLNKGYGYFTEMGQASGIAKTDWSWAALITDLDNDGLKDIYVTNGIEREYNNQDVRKKVKEISDLNQPVVLDDILNMFPSEPIVNHVYKNNDGLIFEPMMTSWGMTDKTFSFGAVYADLDNDGDLEIITNNLNAPASIYKNNSNRNYLQIKLSGNRKNKQAIGTKVFVRTSENIQTQEVYLARGYASSVSPILNFGLGSIESIEEVIVQWPDTRTTTIKNPKINTLLSVDYSSAIDKKLDIPEKQPTYLKKVLDASTFGFDYTHKENDFDDYKVQLLLPQKQSTKGSGIAKADLNSDGLEDIFVGNAKGAEAATYLQKEDGTFVATNTSLWKKEARYEDANAVFFDADGDGDQDLYVVSAGYELQENDPLLQDRLYINDGSGQFTKNSSALPAMLISGRSVAVADIDSDGDLDLFVGGNVTPGKYPVAPNSYLLENNKGIFTDISSKNKDLQAPGMVSKAVFTDYDADNDADLLLVGEWMTPTFYNNTNGNFTKVTTEAFANLEGWWFDAIEKDMDGDGDMDYFFGNLGTNNKFQPSKKKPLFVYGTDFDNNGSFDVALSKLNDGKVVPVRGKECSSEQNPFLLDKIKSYKEFASLDMNQIYGEEKLNNAKKYTAHTFESVYVQNDGNGNFTIVPLETMAQLGPTMSMLVRDFNNDGNLDVMGVGAILDAEVETVRYDSNFGYILLGDGKGGFKYSQPYDPFVVSDAKHISEINIKGTPHFFVVGNNAPIEIFTF